MADIVLNGPDTAVPYQPTVFSIINVGILVNTAACLRVANSYLIPRRA